MHTRYAKTKLNLNHGNVISQEVIKTILDHLQHNKTFSLCDDEHKNAVVFFPADLMLENTTGVALKCETEDGFVDAVSTTMYSYRNFMSQTSYKKSSLIIQP